MLKLAEPELYTIRPLVPISPPFPLHIVTKPLLPPDPSPLDRKQYPPVLTALDPDLWDKLFELDPILFPTLIKTLPPPPSEA